MLSLYSEYSKVHLRIQVTTDGRVQVVAGRPLHCSAVGSHRNQQSFSNDWATSTNLIQPQSIAFAPNGDLYVAESDSQRINRVRMVATNGKVRFYKLNLISQRLYHVRGYGNLK